MVQHILNGWYSVDRMNGPDDKEFQLVFTQEWPIGSQTHQFSYTAPYSFLGTGGQQDNGVQDAMLNYRLQVFTETAQRPAFAPRFSLILPMGDENQGFGNGTLGYQINLPVSKIVSDRWTVHFNAGATLFPNVEGHDLVNFNLGASAIFAVCRRLNLMLECVGYFDEEVDDTDRVLNVPAPCFSRPACAMPLISKTIADGPRCRRACWTDFSRPRLWRLSSISHLSISLRDERAHAGQHSERTRVRPAKKSLIRTRFVDTLRIRQWSSAAR